MFGQKHSVADKQVAAITNQAFPFTQSLLDPYDVGTPLRPEQIEAFVGIGQLKHACVDRFYALGKTEASRFFF